MDVLSDWWTLSNAWLAKPLTRGDLLVAGIVVLWPMWQMLAGISRQIAGVARLIRPNLSD